MIYSINTSFKELVYAEVFQTFASRLFLTLSVLNFQIERKRDISIGYSANFAWQIYSIFGDWPNFVVWFPWKTEENLLVDSFCEDSLNHRKMIEVNSLIKNLFLGAKKMTCCLHKNDGLFSSKRRVVFIKMTGRFSKSKCKGKIGCYWILQDTRFSLHKNRNGIGKVSRKGDKDEAHFMKI